MPVLPKQLRTPSKIDEARDGNTDYAPIPEGNYVVELVNISQRTSAAGNERLNFELKVVEDTNGDDEYNNRRVFYGSNINEQGAPWLIRGFDAFGIPHDADIDDMEDYYGTEAKARVAITEYKGEERNDVRSLTPMSVAAATADDDDDWDA